MTTRKKTIIGISAGVGALALAAAVFFVIMPGTAAKEARFRANSLALAREYAAHEEYQRALDIVDRLLIADAADQEARDLLNEVLRSMRLAENGPKADKGSEASQSPDEAAIQARLEAGRRAAALEAERLAEAEAARKKAQEEELARKSAELQAQMRDVQGLVAKGRDAISRDDFSGAKAAFNEALAKMPNGESRFEAQETAEIAEAYYEAFAKKGDAPEGREAAQEAAAYARLSVQKDPVQALPHHTLGKVSRDLRQMDAAVAELKEAVRLDPDNYLYSFDLGRALFTNRDYSEARLAFEASTDLNRNFESAWYNLGGTYRALGRAEDALAAYRRAVGVKPDYATAHREIGRILSAKGDPRGAAEAFNKALQYAPGDLASMRELGVAQIALKDYAAAESSFAKALQASPQDDQTNYNMAVVKINQNKGAEALGYAQKALEAAPSNKLYAYTLGLANEAVGDFDGSVSAYGRAIALDAKYVPPRINLGSLYLANGFAEEALGLLAAAYAQEPRSFAVNNNLGAAYARLEQWDQSVEHYGKALESEPDNATVRINLARALVGSGDLPRARDAYLECLRLDTANGDARLELGKTYISLGDKDSAKRSLQELIRVNPSYTGKAEAERILSGL